MMSEQEQAESLEICGSKFPIQKAAVYTSNNVEITRCGSIKTCNKTEMFVEILGLSDYRTCIIDSSLRVKADKLIGIDEAGIKLCHSDEYSAEQIGKVSKLSELLAKLKTLERQRKIFQYKIISLRKQKENTDRHVAAWLSDRTNSPVCDTCTSLPPIVSADYMQTFEKLFTWRQEKSHQDSQILRENESKLQDVSHEIWLLLHELNFISPHFLQNNQPIPNLVDNLEKTIEKFLTQERNRMENFRRWNIKLKLLVPEDLMNTDVLIEIKYITNNARWSPSYDVRLISVEEMQDRERVAKS